jgi:Fe-S-cluster containining protein
MQPPAPDAYFRSLEDIGIRVPPAMPQPIDAEIEKLVAQIAGTTRGAGIVIAAQEIARDPSASTKLRTVLALLKLLGFGRAQQTIDALQAEAPKLGCREGCAYCCYQSVEVTIPEAILVAVHLADPEDPRREALLARIDAQASKSKPERRHRGRPCPLLVDSRCSVYEDRPLMCRSVFAADSADCRASLESIQRGGPELPVEQFLTAQYLMLSDQAGIRGICKDMGLQHDLVELSEGVAAILRDPGIIERWISGERVFGPELTIES